MRAAIRPEPDADVRAAIVRALADRAEALRRHPAYASQWRRSGLDYATARPRSRRGATRA